MQQLAVRQDTDLFRSLVVGLLPIAALIVTSTTDRPLSQAMWLRSKAVAELILCVFLGLLLMISGFGVMIIDRENEVGKWLLGVGAFLAATFFAGCFVFGIGYALLRILGAVAGG